MWGTGVLRVGGGSAGGPKAATPNPCQVAVRLENEGGGLKGEASSAFVEAISRLPDRAFKIVESSLKTTLVPRRLFLIESISINAS